MNRSVFALLGLLAAACGTETSNDDEGSSATSSTTGAGAGTTCYSVPVNQSGSGESACGPSVCEAGTYCSSTVGICDPGCLDELDCAPGQFCDFANAVGNPPVGLCRAPGPAEEEPCTEQGCLPRCRAKATTCQAPTEQADAACSQLCGLGLTEEQIGCLEQTGCAELAEAFEGSGMICGISSD